MSELRDNIDREPFHSILKEKLSGKFLHIYNFHLQPKNLNPKSELLSIGEKSAAFERKNVIISGDFNLSHKATDPTFEGILGLKHQIEEKTSLKSKEVNGDYRAFEYDNIYTSSEIDVKQIGVFDFVQKVGNLKESKKISDHLIPWIYFKIK
jgi:endonuclease/exonuclease/phosphatase family metal-dependent hydrolase